MLPEHGLRVVDVRPGDRTHARLANAGGSGWLVCPLAPRPQGKGDRLQAVCDALLAAMGKSHELGGSQRNTREQLREIVAWLIAEDVSQLLMLDGHYVGAGCWMTLIDFAVETGVGLVIACDANELRRGHKDLLAAYAIPWRTTEDLLAQMPPAPAEHEASGGWPPLPESHFTTFAAEMRDLLAPDRRRQAENEYREAAARTHAWLAERPVVDGEELARFLLDLVAGVPWTEQTVLRLKAAQAALFVAGWLVEVNFDRFLADTEGTVQLTPETTARLRRYSQAAPPAAAVLSMLTRRSSEALAAVKLSDLAPDGSTVAVDAGSYEVPAHARSILRAQMWQRLLEGAVETAPLFHERRSRSANDAARGGASTEASWDGHQPRRRQGHPRVVRAQGSSVLRHPASHRCRDPSHLADWKDAMAEARLDPDRVRQAREELGLSQRALGRHLGLSITFVRDLEAGRGQSGYGMSLLGRLADVLERDLRTLLAPQGANGDDETNDGTADAPVAGSDSAVLAAALMSAGRPLSRTDVAKALGWTLERTHAAFNALRGDLAGTGLRLQTVGGARRWAVRAADELLSERQRDGLEGAVHVAWGLQLDEARLLHRIATSRVGRSEWDRCATNNDRVSLATLRKRGLVTTAGEYYALTPPAAYSLGLAAKTVTPPRTRKPARSSKRVA